MVAIHRLDPMPARTTHGFVKPPVVEGVLDARGA